MVWLALPKGASQGVPMGELGAAGIMNRILPPYLPPVVTGGFMLVVVWVVGAAVVVVCTGLDVVVVALVGGAVVVVVVVVTTGAEVEVVDVVELQPVMIKARIKKTTRGTKNFFMTTSFFILITLPYFLLSLSW